MSDLVEIDDDSDVESQEITHESAPTAHQISSKLENLRTMKRELDFHGSMLGKTWSDLSEVLTRYQSELVTKYDQYETTCVGLEGHERIAQLESVIEKKAVSCQRLENTLHDLEAKLLEKDGEIVVLRTDVHKFRNEVSMKDNLINKLQNQMAKESMEYTTQITSLKEILELENTNMTGMENCDLGIRKKRRLADEISLGLHDAGAELSAHSLLSHQQSGDLDMPDISVVKVQIEPSSCAMDKTIMSHPSEITQSRSWRMNKHHRLPTVHGITSSFQSFPTHSDQGLDSFSHLATTSSSSLPGVPHTVTLSQLDSQAALLQQGADFNDEKPENAADIMAALEHQPSSSEASSDLAHQPEPQMLIQNVHSMTSPQQPKQAARALGFPAPARPLNQNVPSPGGPKEGFYCQHCGKVFTSSAGCDQHERIHLGIKPFRCRLCGKRFTQRFACSRHLKVHTGVTAPRKDLVEVLGRDSGVLPSSETTFLHTHCDKTNSRSALQWHELSHGRFGRFACSGCERSYSTKGARDRHFAVVHSAAGIHRCRHCHKVFMREETKIRHELAHTGGILL